ncbi:MAG: hypothetical protein Kow00121_08570 [Elainellaceae cyanobacterium]
MSEQPSLFSVAELQTGRYLSQPKPLTISRDALQDWKQRIFEYQQQVQSSPLVEQGSLFEAIDPAAIEPSPINPAISYLESTNPDDINPFTLSQQNTMFWRWKVADSGTSALYFVIDYELPLLLYVGETCKSGQRWKGEHDCKRYIDNYQSAHYPHQLPTRLGIAFWAKAPKATKARQTLESTLIYKWRSPFNKENWEFWGTPFVGGK